MRYFKWMFENEPTVHRIPGFVFISIKDALKYSSDFEEWMSNPTGAQKNLFTFVGVKPTLIKQGLTSRFGQPMGSRVLPEISNIGDVLGYFEKFDAGYFSGPGHNEVPLMLAVAQEAGCIKCREQREYIAGCEALYVWPVTMKMVSPAQIISMQMGQ